MNVSLKYGIVSAAIGIVIFIARAIIDGNPFGKNWMFTVVSIAIGVVVIVLAHREFKNNGDGFMSFGQGFKIGFMVTLISFIVSGIFTFIYTSVIDTTLMDTFYLSQREEMERAGTMNDQAIDTAIEWTQKLFWPFFLIGGLFSSALMGVVVPIFTQKRNPEPSI
jgi:hypothetical protein